MFSLLLKLLRPKHWIKNLLVFSAVVFSFANGSEIWRDASFAFLGFCFTASAVYVFNDILDQEADRQHPRKKNRPIASGQINMSTASGIIIILLCLTTLFARLLPIAYSYALLSYVGINIIYSFFLKQKVILDVMMIAFGFVMRVMAGGLALGIPVSHWIMLYVFFIALFLGFGKRKHETELLNDQSRAHRQVLEQYTPEFLNQLIAVTSAMTIISYALYTINPQTIAHFHTENLIYTIPFVVYGVFHYYHLLYNHTTGEDPVRIFLYDRGTAINLISWFILFHFITH